MAITIEYKDVENKLLILYLINRLELPMSRAQITDFIMQKELMNYFTLEQTIASMVEANLLDAVKETDAADVNTTQYTVTEEGLTTLEFFESHITYPVRQMINRYIEENRGKIKKDYETVANYFPNVENNEFKVKCGVYEDKRAIIELFVSVDTREQAKLIQSNWRANASGLYVKIIEALTEERKRDEEEDTDLA